MMQARAIGRWWAVLAMLALAVCALPLAAQPTPRPNNIALDLVADGQPQPGSTWTLALRFTPKSPEWHGYWSNPGDAGAPMRLDWVLPDGWSAGEPKYPVPHLLEIAGLANHVFEGEYAVLVPIKVPADARIADLPSIRLTADYLACTDRICVPEHAEVSIDPSAARDEPRFADWRSRLAPDLDRQATATADGRVLRLAVPLPASLAISQPHVFVETPELVQYAAPQAFSRKGDHLIATLELADGAKMPESVTGILALGDGEGIRFTAVRGPVPTGGTLLAPTSAPAPDFWITLLAAFLGGLILNVMPCVFPILSLKALALAKAGGDEGGARRDALAYTSGTVLVTLALGALLLVLRAGGQQIGWAFQLQEPGVVVALFVLAVALTANFLGLFEIPGMAIAGGGASQSGSFGTGLLAAFVATPCTGPFMAAALGAALLLPAVEALALFAALGLGLAFPFLLLGFVPALRSRLPRPGKWMETFRRWMALPMGLTALALAWLVWRLGGVWFALGAGGTAIAFSFALMQFWGGRRGHFAGPVAATVALVLAASLPFLVRAPGPGAVQTDALLASSPFSEDRLAAARRDGPVFVYFTADWCLTCKVNEGAAIERESTRDAFKSAGVTVLRGDWTRRDPEITRFLTAQGAAGVPLYLWYPGQGDPVQQLPQVLTPGLLAELARGSDRSARREAG
ncbi:protein-disulfide reductase DsbD family protein [Qipengyuania sp.]|uniref:protein-disulfide reductase DsbD family protein n=1 Tax=Qipengyuania sp. TaxID=2004515 RepID=UPI0035C7C7DA